MKATDVRMIGASALTAAAVSLITVAVIGMKQNECKPPAPAALAAPSPAAPPSPAPAAAAAAVPEPAPGLDHGDLAILGVETADPMGDAVVISEVLSAVMRVAATRVGHPVAPGREADLAHEKTASKCAALDAECLTAIGHRLYVDRLVYGRLATGKGGFEVKLDLFDVKTERIVRSASFVIPAKEAEGEGLDAWGERMISMLLGPGSCDAAKHKEDGMGFINGGQHASALASFEASLRCHHDPYVVQLAFMEACASSNETKAKHYYGKLSPAQQTRFAQICIRNKTAYK